MKTKADHIEKLKREVEDNLRELHEVFGVDVDALEKLLSEALLNMRADGLERQPRK
jgi:hypothetical protein